jgi:phage-related protein
MHEIVFYVDRHGKSTLLDYIAELEASKSKDSRIKLTKIRDYVKALAINGTYLPEMYVKHLDGEIWELRPIDDRILFAGWVDGAFVLLHSFVKKTQKTPKREIEQAKRELADFKEREGKA